MAITDVPAFAHLTEADIENLAVELDAIRLDIEDSRGERDSRYIRRTIAAQRAVEVAGRLMLAAGSGRSAWWAGTVTLGVAKIIENMEIGHNVMHGQWDWMNDPEIHSSTWEWDMSGASKHWRFTHNFMHHKYTNILGMDDDVGYGLLRVTRDQRGSRSTSATCCSTPCSRSASSGVSGCSTWNSARSPRAATTAPPRWCGCASSGEGRPPARQGLRRLPRGDVAVPRATFRSTLKANAVANVIRNVWANAVIFCGHFPDGAEKFTKTDMVGESKGQWYLRQMLGSANFEGGPALRFMSGNLCHQIEHHLYPDLPSNRLHEISFRVGRSATSTTCRIRRARSWCSTARRGGPSPSCRCRTSTCATPSTTLRRPAASGCSPSWIPGSAYRSRHRTTRGLRTAIATVRSWRRDKRAEKRAPRLAA